MALALESDLADLLGLTHDALLLVDGAGTLRYINPAAQRLVGRTGMLSTAGGVVSVRRKAEARELRDALASLSAARPTSIVCLRNREGLPVSIIDLHRLSSGLLALRVSNPASRPTPSLARLRQIFGLTPAEARVASAMLSGLGIQGVAQRHGVEPETVRSQAKRLRSKTGARSQAQLLAILVATGPDFGTQSEHQAVARQQPS